VVDASPQARQVATDHVDLYGVERAGRGGGPQEDRPPTDQPRPARHPCREEQDTGQLREPRRPGCGVHAAREHLDCRRISLRQGDRQGDGLEVRVVLQRDRHIGELEQVPAPADALDAVLGGVVEQPGDLAVVQRNHADRTERGRTRAMVAATRVSGCLAAVVRSMRAAPAELDTHRWLRRHVLGDELEGDAGRVGGR
jgi:hypothetical protein